MVRIVTDSTANLSDELVEEHNITVVPLVVQIGSQTLHDGVDISAEEFIERLPNEDPLPTTSQPTPLDFEERYREILDAGDEILSIHLSSDLSGTWNSARNASLAFDDAPITVVDTRTVSAGTALMVLAAAEMVRNGLGRVEIVERLQPLIGQGSLLLTLETLEFLRRGGRIGGAQAFLGGLLRVKPIIEIKNGVLEPGERARSRKRALKQIVDTMQSRYGTQPVWVGSAEAAADDVDALEQLARESLNVQRMIRCSIGPAVATHAGPGTIGLCAMPVPELG